MEVLNDVQFLRRDNANLLQEVKSLRSQSALLRSRSDELEKKLREQILACSVRNEVTVNEPKFLDIVKERPTVPKLRLDMQFGETSHITIASRDIERSPFADIGWFDDSPTQQRIPTKTDKETPDPHGLRPASSGSALIGEAPLVATFGTPPSPDPSEGPSQIPLPSLRSVAPPVTGVALPRVALSLLHLRLIRKETYDSPASVASFMQKLEKHTRTRTPYPPQSSYRAAFTAAFLTLIPLLGPPGTLPAEWLAFLHDFPSRIPATQRDSIVSIPWPTSGISIPGINLESLRRQSITYRLPSQPHYYRRRSRSLSGITRDVIPSSASEPTPLSIPPPPPPLVNPTTTPPAGGAAAATSFPPCERDAWVLLLALAYAAFPFSRVAKKLYKLPSTVKLQMIAWLPPGVNVYAHMEFASKPFKHEYVTFQTVDEALRELWDSKKEILRLISITLALLEHGWP
ncbi:hypothetical protein BU17DRAFT_61472 [Hysterangium stoloniferum]|nr:hypothetical protein BU17DRAFT_61472 [Hysterangium stoloniferum]